MFQLDAFRFRHRNRNPQQTHNPNKNIEKECWYLTKSIHNCQECSRNNKVCDPIHSDCNRRTATSCCVWINFCKAQNKTKQNKNQLKYVFTLLLSLPEFIIHGIGDMPMPKERRYVTRERSDQSIPQSSRFIKKAAPNTTRDKTTTTNLSSPRVSFQHVNKPHSCQNMPPKVSNKLTQKSQQKKLTKN